MAIPLLALAALVVQPQPFEPTNDVFQWTVGGAYGGFGLKWKDGGTAAAVVEDGAKRRPGPVRTDDLTLELGRALEPAVHEWLRAALAGEATAVRDLELLELSRPQKAVVRASRYPGARIRELVLPAMHANDRCTLDDQ